MEITILKQIDLEKIPSGSGIVKAGNGYYVIGDDSPFLFKLNHEFQTISKIGLTGSDQLVSDRIAKAEKSDFESLEMISDEELVVFGSGSKSPQRDVFLRILLRDPLVIEHLQISKFYDELRNLPLFENSDLNIEATAFRNNQLFLFNRRKNLIVNFDYPQLLSYLQGKGGFPKMEIKEFFLPKINGTEAGFSGAATLKNESKIIFTASVEDTDNAYDDGKILGSFIGLIDISNNTISDHFTYCTIPNTIQALKVESVTVVEEISPSETKIVMVTDDDHGSSILIEALLNR